MLVAPPLSRPHLDRQGGFTANPKSKAPSGKERRKGGATSIYG
jgi:hypothetical protein